MKIGGLRYVLRGKFSALEAAHGSGLSVVLSVPFGGIAVFVVAAKCMNRRRNHETAVNKVMKRLGKLGKKPSRVYKNVTLKTEDGGQSLDGIVLDRGGIRLVQSLRVGDKDLRKARR